MNTELFQSPDLKEVMEDISEEAFLVGLCKVAHDAIHSKNKESIMAIIVRGKEYPITYATNGCRKIDYENKIIFMEQNKNTLSGYAKEAREGKRITWGIRNLGGWIYIDDNGPKL